MLSVKVDACLKLAKFSKLLIAAQDTIHRQAVVCHRVLRRVQELAQQSQVLFRNCPNCPRYGLGTGPTVPGMVQELAQ